MDHHRGNEQEEPTTNLGRGLVESASLGSRNSSTVESSETTEGHTWCKPNNLESNNAKNRPPKSAKTKRTIRRATHVRVRSAYTRPTSATTHKSQGTMRSKWKPSNKPKRTERSHISTNVVATIKTILMRPFTKGKKTKNTTATNNNNTTALIIAKTILPIDQKLKN